MEQTNFDIEQGATFMADIKIVDADDNPVDLTGTTFRGQVRKTASSDKIYGVFSFTPTNLAQGMFTVILSAAETSALPCHSSPTAIRTITSFAYDIEAKYSDGSVERLLSGMLNVSPEVTR